jgi:ABC-type multidrug transport system fused ATPase/permease subunit
MLSFRLPHVDRFMQMVLDAGNIVEFGKPSELLQIKDGKLKALVDESGDKDTLYEMTR